MSDLSPQAQTKLIKFTKDLIIKGSGIFHDGFKRTKIEIGKDILRNRIDKLEDCYLVTQDESKTAIMNYGIDKFNFLELSNPDKKTILSIGTFDAHNQSKQHKGYLITVPLPLTNDSFCTDRCNPPKGDASFRCRFPDEIIIDLDFLSQVPFEVHLLGLGEFIGIYYSIIDYSKSRNMPVPINLLEFISDLFNKMIKLIIENEQEIFLIYLSAGLALKCCIMRQANDHEIGCGGDHMIADVLEENYKLSHGQAVLYGAIIMASLFPEWKQFGLSEEDLIKFGSTTALLDLALFYEIKQTSSLINKAISHRPKRVTLLQDIHSQYRYKIDSTG